MEQQRDAEQNPAADQFYEGIGSKEAERRQHDLKKDDRSSGVRRSTLNPDEDRFMESFSVIDLRAHSGCRRCYHSPPSV